MMRHSARHRWPDARRRCRPPAWKTRLPPAARTLPPASTGYLARHTGFLAIRGAPSGHRSGDLCYLYNMATTTGAGLEGIVATSSNICFIDGDEGILSYQGFDIHTLAENATFEEVIYLLWHGNLPKRAELDQLKAALVKFRPISDEITGFLKSVPKAAPMDVLRTAVSMLGLYDPLASDNSIEASLEKAQHLMAQTATIVTTYHRLRSGEQVIAGDPRLGFAANFLYTLTGKKPDDVMERAFDLALILHADHELNASTFAGRVTAATLSDIHSAVTSAIGALKGPLHGGANEDVIRMLLAAGDERKALEHVQEMLAAKKKIREPHTSARCQKNWAAEPAIWISTLLPRRSKRPSRLKRV